ncbi:MAG: hypothetical protein ACOCR8_03235, partial [Desulfosalsimonas sp.]
MTRSQPLFKRPYPGRSPWIAVILTLFLLIPALRVIAQEEEIQSIDPAEIRENTSGLYRNFELSLDNAIETESGKLETVSRKLESAKHTRDKPESRILWLQLMISTHSNLLLSAETGIQALERAKISQTVAIGYAREQIQKTEEEIAGLQSQKQEVEEQAGSYEKQKAEMDSHPPHLGADRNLGQKLENLISILEKRGEKTARLLEIKKSRLEKLNALLPELESLSSKIDAQIKRQKKSSILEHHRSPAAELWEGKFGDDFSSALQKSAQWLFYEAWQIPDFVPDDQYFTFLGIFLFLLILLELLLYRIDRYLKELMQQCLDEGMFWQYLAVKMIQKTLMPAGVILYLYFYPIRPVFMVTPVFILIPLLIRVLILLTVIRLFHVFLRSFAARTENIFFHRLYLPLNHLLYGVFIYGTGYFFISRVVCYNCITLISWRLLFEFILLLWALRSSALVLREDPDSDSAGSSRIKRFKPVFAALGVCLVLPGIAAELAGYGGLAVYWYSGLAKSVLVIFLAAILMRLLRESDVPAHIERSEDADGDELADGQPYPMRWLLVR